MGINVVEKIDDFVKVQNILVSVSDKSGLEQFIPNLVEINPQIQIFSTGGTYGRISEILGDSAANRLMQVSDYTGQPETQGGLVKTLDFKIYLGLLTERYNPAHRQDLARTGALPIDLVVVNLYPFRETVARPDATLEDAIEKGDLTEDWYLMRGGDTERKLSILTAWVLWAERRQVPYSLEMPGAALPADLGEAHRDACLEILALFEK